jgi:hypothetical protein
MMSAVTRDIGMLAPEPEIARAMHSNCPSITLWAFPLTLVFAASACGSPSALGPSAHDGGLGPDVRVTGTSDGDGSGAPANEHPDANDTANFSEGGVASEDAGHVDDAPDDSDPPSGTASPFRFQVALDLNTYKASYGTDVATLSKFHSDFLYTITVNSDLTDDEYRTALSVLSPTHWVTSEDNPSKSDSYTRLLAALGKVDDSVCYNETGSTPGGTLLSDSQIDGNAASHGGTVTVLTRDYSTRWIQWRQETDRCLANAKVTGVVLETANPYSDQDAVDLVNATLAKGKRQYFLLPGGDTAYTLSSINYLLNKAPAAMADSRVHFIIYNYSKADAWFGEWNTQQGTLNAVYDIAHGSGSATFYAQDSFGGAGVTLGTGSYTTAQLGSIGLANDSALSIRVYAGTKVTLYQNDNFGGFSTALVASVDNLSTITSGRTSGTWASDVSSVKIERQ